MYILTKRSFARRDCPWFSWKSFIFSFYPGMSLNSLIFCPGKMLKMSLKVLECSGILNKNLSGHHVHISGTIHHVTVICGKHLLDDNIFRCFFYFFKILIFGVHRGVKGQKTMSVLLHIWGTIDHMIVIYGANV